MCKSLKSQIVLVHAMSTVLFKVSYLAPAHVLQQRGCSEQQHLLSPRYSFPWPSSKAMLNQPSQDTQRHLFFTKFFVPLLPVENPALEMFLSQFPLLLVFLWNGNFTCEVSASRSAWRPWDPPEVLLEKQEEEKHTPEWIFNSWRVRSQEMRPGGSSCDCVCFWGAPWTWTSDSWVKDAVNRLVESVLNLLLFFGIKVKIIITKCEWVSDHWCHH